jgi:hypothetical protein
MTILLNHKIELLVKLGHYMLSEDQDWLLVKDRAVQSNQWFTSEHIDIAVKNIVQSFLQKEKLEAWIAQYNLPKDTKTIGLTMAGNIPLVGFHDVLCCYISGHKLVLKYSSKDRVLLEHLILKLTEWAPETAEQIQSAEMLKNCDAYIATGSNNSARYFEQYFSKYPHIIRRNRTSIAVLDGNESKEDLQKLADDVFCYFGLGCRNVTQICVPKGYDFEHLFDAFKRYEGFNNHHKYRNNFDYYLAIYLLNRIPYLSNESVLLVENEVPFSSVAVLHYRYYDDKQLLMEGLKNNNDIQCIVGNGFIPFGESQIPSLNDYADGIDVMQFLCSL